MIPRAVLSRTAGINTEKQLIQSQAIQGLMVFVLKGSNLGSPGYFLPVISTVIQSIGSDYFQQLFSMVICNF